MLLIAGWLFSAFYRVTAGYCYANTSRHSVWTELGSNHGVVYVYWLQSGQSRVLPPPGWSTYAFPQSFQFLPATSERGFVGFQVYLDSDEGCVAVPYWLFLVVLLGLLWVRQYLRRCRAVASGGFQVVT